MTNELTVPVHYFNNVDTVAQNFSFYPREIMRSRRRETIVAVVTGQRSKTM